MFIDPSFPHFGGRAAPVLQPDSPLTHLLNGGALDRAGSRALFARLVEGELAEPEIAAMLTALRLRGETEEELIGAAQALRAADLPFERPDYLFADTCGTGGDGSGTINVSTSVAFVAAAAGLPVAKHGNRSFTSRCGSADVLEELGARLEMSATAARRTLDETGFCFLFAPLYHPGLRHAGPARRALKVRTIMNLLGPCLNPAEPGVQLLGVADPRLVGPIAATLAALGVERALVVHGSGLDEVALHGTSDAVLLEGGRLRPLTITPEDAGLARSSVEGIKGGTPKENAARLTALLQGKASQAEADSVALNAGALLMTAGLAPDLREGVAHATEIIRSGAAHHILEAFIEASHA